MAKVENKIVEDFLKELAKLTDKYGVEIDGCGCCGSPYLTGKNGKGDSLYYDREDSKYYVSGSEIEI